MSVVPKKAEGTLPRVGLSPGKPFLQHIEDESAEHPEVARTKLRSDRPG